MIRSVFWADIGVRGQESVFVIEVISTENRAQRFVSYDVFHRMEEHCRDPLVGIFAYRPVRLTGAVGGSARAVAGEAVSGSYFDDLNVVILSGRPITAADVSGRQDVAVISERLWDQRLARHPAAIGSSLVIDGKPIAVIGIAAASFKGLAMPRLVPTDIWVPLQSDVIQEQSLTRPSVLLGGRLPRRLADDELKVSTAGCAGVGGYKDLRLTSLSSIWLNSRIDRLLVPAFAAVVVLTLLLLLSTSATAGLLLMARLSPQLMGLAVRQALGASQARLAAMILGEQLIWSAIGAGAGVLLVHPVMAHLVSRAQLFGGALPVAIEHQVDGQTLIAVLLVVVSTAMVSAFPAIRRLRELDIAIILRDNSGATSRGDSRRRSLLVSTQVVACVIMSTVTALLAARFIRQEFIARQIAPGRVGVIEWSQSGMAAPPTVADALVRLVQRHFGEHAVAVADGVPFEAEAQRQSVLSADASASILAEVRKVSEHYFDVLGLTLRDGRSFGAPRDSAAGAIVSESVARRLWSGSRAIGQWITVGPQPLQRYQIIGTVEDVNSDLLDGTVKPLLYLPAASLGPPMRVLIQLGERPLTDLDRLVKSAAPSGVSPNVYSLDARINRLNAPVRTASLAAGIMAAFTWIIAMTGVFSLRRYDAWERRREIAVRIALGAPSRQVLWSQLRAGMIPVGAGMLLGLVGALFVRSVMPSAFLASSTAEIAATTGPALIVGLVAVAASVLGVYRVVWANDPTKWLRKT